MSPLEVESSILDVGRSSNLLRQLDYSILQQCMHCGLCLPTCPTYVETKNERNSPRGRISLMRAIADEKFEATAAFGEEMYYCLGCLACESACPAGVQYAHLFEMARGEVERTGVLRRPGRDWVRRLTLGWLFQKQSRLRVAGKLLRVYQASGLQALSRTLGLTRLLPRRLRDWENKTPTVRKYFSPDLIAPVETPAQPRYRVGLLTGCVQDLTFSEINRDTADVLLANGCEVFTPPPQGCCGSLHAHNGDLEGAKTLARQMLDQFPLEKLDAIITNAAGCGSHLKHYDRLLADDPVYRPKAQAWSRKVKDIHEFLVEIQFRIPNPEIQNQVLVTYHEACHLCHGQKISRSPRQILEGIPGLILRELPEATWCCGSAGVYNLTQPETAQIQLDRKMKHIRSTGADIVATANPGCLLQIQQGAQQQGLNLSIVHPVTLLAQAYRAETKTGNF
jgi:glycolate oxidase iron-sulfur subunit